MTEKRLWSPLSVRSGRDEKTDYSQAVLVTCLEVIIRHCSMWQEGSGNASPNLQSCFITNGAWKRNGVCCEIYPTHHIWKVSEALKKCEYSM